MLKFLFKIAGRLLYCVFIMIIIAAVAAKNVMIEVAKGAWTGLKKSWPEIKRIVMRDPTKPITVEFSPVEG